MSMPALGGGVSGIGGTLGSSMRSGRYLCMVAANLDSSLFHQKGTAINVMPISAHNSFFCYQQSEQWCIY